MAEQKDPEFTSSLRLTLRTQMRVEAIQGVCSAMWTLVLVRAIFTPVLGHLWPSNSLAWRQPHPSADRLSEDPLGPLSASGHLCPRACTHQP